MPKVYLPQMPSRYDAKLRCWIPTINIEPAKQFGDVEVVMPPDAGRLGTDAMADAVMEAMQHFKEEDYLVGVGDPVIISLCAIAAADNVERIKFLRWDRMSGTYATMEFDL